MTSGVLATDGPDEDRHDDGPPGAIEDGVTRRDRRLYWVVAALTIAPILISAVRAGFNGWIPTNDAAAAVLRAKHSLGFPPTLVGLYAWPSSHAIDAVTYTAGPWQLWWMSLPVKVLGVTWGPLLSMAVLNSLFLLLAGWGVRRRFGSRSAIAAMVFLCLLIWSFGADSFHSPVPVVAVIAPFAAFCFTAWALADGDERALPIAAGLGTYLVLCHPATTMLVPVIGVAAVVIWLVVLRANRIRDVSTHRARGRRSKRAVLWAVAISVALWTPALIQQFTADEGNLTHLYRASNEMPAWLSLRRTVASVFSLFAGSPFWLRGSAEDSFLTFTAPVPTQAATLWTAIGLGAALITAGLVALRRRDRSAVSALVLAVAALVASWLHLLRSPHGQYFLSIWVIAMFTTCAVAFALARALGDRVRTAATLGAVALVAVLGVANLPDQPIPHFTAGTQEQRAISTALNHRIIPEVRGRGTVTVAPAFNDTFKYASALVVALDEAGIPMCDWFIVSFRGYDNPGCEHSHPGVIVTYRSAATFAGAPEGETVVARHISLTPAEQRTWQELSLEVSGAIRTLDQANRPLPLTESYQDEVHQGRAPALFEGDLDDFVDDPGRIAVSFNTQEQFATFVTAVDDQFDGRVVYARLPGVSDANLLAWARLRAKLAEGVVVTVKAAT